MTTLDRREPSFAGEGGVEEPAAPTPSTQRGPLAGLDDLARLLEPGGTGRKLATGLAIGMAIGGVVAALRSIRRR